jgi:protocatechuate 3,4-dioxygenase beta subunit
MDNPDHIKPRIDSQEAQDAKNNEGERLTTRRTVISAMGTLGLGTAGFALISCSAEQTKTTVTPTATNTPTATSTATSASTTIATPTPTCTLTAELTEGPYYLDVDKIRTDITEDREGVPLKLRITVVDTTACKVVAGAAVEVWHCDAKGYYSGFTANNPDGGGGMGGQSDQLTFLRGTQLSNANGIAEFASVYPGWYTGRALHIHTKVHIGGTITNNAYEGGHISHTGQFFFDESITDQVAKVEPYASRTTQRTRIEEDTIYPTTNTSGALLKLTLLEEGKVEAGYLGEVTVGIDPDTTPTAS